MEMNNAMEFSSILVKRGMGMLGRDRMVEICTSSGITLLEDDTIKFNNGDLENIIKLLIINFSSRNLIAKMTATSLASKYNIAIPDELKSKRKKKSRWRRFLRK